MAKALGTVAALIVIWLACAVLFGAGKAPESPQESHWYEGGTLHRASAAQWTAATPENRLATAADWVASTASIKAKVQEVNGLKPYARQMEECVTGAAKTGTGDAADLAAACAVLLGWN